jgi:chromate reductase
MVSILAIPGSLRQASYNRGLARAAVAVAPPGIEVAIAELHDVPLYNADVEAVGDPPAVAALKQAVMAADGLLLLTPENNGSLPGVLKNCLDWVSRPPEQALFHKPVALAGATPGAFATLRSQLAVTQTLRSTRNPVLAEPVLQVSRAQEKFDADGNLVDSRTRDQLTALMVAFADWIERTRG